MTQELKQARAAIRAKIKENPTTIIITRSTMVDDGFEGQIEDPFGTTTEHVYKVRLSHERKIVETAEMSPAGVSTNLGRFILTDYKTTISEGDKFSAIGKSWEIGKVDPLWAYGGIKGYQAPLREAEPVPEGEA